MASFVESSKKRIVLFIIDPQNDFHVGGSLGVPGAIEDSERTATFIRQHIRDIDEIYVSLDSHHKLHIAHAGFWKNAAGESPSPFTLIHSYDITGGLWTPRNEKYLEWAISYTKTLEEKGRFVLCIWPEHCLIGTNGHNVYPTVNDALQEWAAANLKTIHYVQKGEHCLTEMYSAISAEVPVDGAGEFNEKLFEECVNTEKLVVCGQALSHCVNFTVRDIASRIQQRGGPLGVIHLLRDACSPVPGFESSGEEFVSDMTNIGVHITTTKDFVV